MSKIDIENQQVFANDEVAEPFQPMPTWERWRQRELWQNREGTVVRTGLYLKDRKEIADLFAENDADLEKIVAGYKEADEAIQLIAETASGEASSASQKADEAVSKASEASEKATEVETGYKAADTAINATIEANKTASEEADKALSERIDAISGGGESDYAYGTLVGLKDDTEYFTGTAMGTKVIMDGEFVAWSFTGSVSSGAMKVGDDVSGISVNFEPLGGDEITNVQTVINGQTIAKTSDEKFVALNLVTELGTGKVRMYSHNFGDSAEGSVISANHIVIA